MNAITKSPIFNLKIIYYTTLRKFGGVFELMFVVSGITFNNLAYYTWIEIYIDSKCYSFVIDKVEQKDTQVKLTLSRYSLDKNCCDDLISSDSEYLAYANTCQELPM